MSKRRKLFSALTLLALMFSLVPFLGESVANAQTPPTGTPVATGVIAPRYIYATDDGTIYFTEASAGGNSETITPHLTRMGHLPSRLSAATPAELVKSAPLVQNRTL